MAGESALFVSVIIPALNEEQRIGACLAALTTQTYPAERMEILVADGRSTDGTREVVLGHTSRDSRIRLLDNPSGRTATALNTAIENARGSVICRMDAHAVPAADYVAQCVAVLQESEAWCVGGQMEKVGTTPMSEAIAAAATSRFGIGDSTFHYAKTPQAVESVYLGCWPKSVFERVGVFNPALVRNQDDELSYRIRRAGGVIWFDPRITVRYHGRESLGRLFRQYRQYGYWKVRVFQLHLGAIRWRHLAPGALVGSLVLSAALVPLLPYARLVLVATLLTYGVASLVAADRVARQAPRISRAHVIGAFAAMHLGYGTGFWIGLTSALTALVRVRPKATPV